MPVLLKLAQERQITAAERNWEDICATDLPYLQINYFSLELGKLQEKKSFALDQSYPPVQVKPDRTLAKKKKDTKKPRLKGALKDELVQPFMEKGAKNKNSKLSEKLLLAIFRMEHFRCPFRKRKSEETVKHIKYLNQRRIQKIPKQNQKFEVRCLFYRHERNLFLFYFYKLPSRTRIKRKSREKSLHV